MHTAKFNKQKFVKAFYYTFLIQITITIFISIIWFILVGTLFNYPFGIITFGLGGIFLSIAGCVGPGRYQKSYDLVLYAPTNGSSFSNEVIISGFFVKDSNLNKADIFVNAQKVGVLQLIDNVGQVSIPREVIVEQTINSIWLQLGNQISNKNYFTFFDYTEDLTDDEIDSFVELENMEREFDITKIRDKYLKKSSTQIGSIAWGIAASALFIMLIGSIYEIIKFN